MKRREFITLLGGAAAAWPLVARAQQLRLPTIGYLGATTSSASEEGPRLTVLVQRLKELGWIEGRTVGIEYRWAGGHTERFTDFAAEFARLKVDLIVTYSTPAVIAVKQITSAVPIVFAGVADPVGTGLVASLAALAAMRPVCRFKQQISRANASNSFARSFRVSVGWLSSPTSTVPMLCWRWLKSRKPPVSSTWTSSRWKSDEPRRLPLRSIGSRAGQKRFMCPLTQ